MLKVIFIAVWTILIAIGGIVYGWLLCERDMANNPDRYLPGVPEMYVSVDPTHPE